MGFGGGGSGSFVLPNHLHTNGAADGGDLEEAVTLVDGATMLAWWNAKLAAAATGSLELLDSHKAVGTESTYTFTPGTALALADYSAIRVYIAGSSTASFELRCVINALGGTSYRSSGTRNSNGVNTGIATGTPAHLVLMSATMNNVAQEYAGYLELQMNDAGGDFLIGYSSIGDENARREYYLQGRLSDVDTITSIEIKTSASTWATGSTIDIYGVQK